MGCDRYLELLSLRLDGELSGDEERELEEHLSGCPDCRAAGAQLAALQGAFDELEDIPAPEGFTRGVIDRIGASEPPKVIPLRKRPHFRALAGLAACLALAVGLYGRTYLSKRDANADDGRWDLMTRGFSQDASAEDIPMITAQAAPVEPKEDETDGALYRTQKCAPDGPVCYDGVTAAPAAPMVNAEVLTLDRMPEGGWELIPPETPVSPEGVHITAELFAELEQLAAEQGIPSSLIASEEDAEEFIIVVLEETK